MGHKTPRAALVVLGAAVGAFAAGAMMSAATAPTARADAYSDIIADIQAEEAAAQADFSAASTDFASGTAGEPAGLTALFEGVDDDTFGVADDLHVGLVDALTNTTVIPASDFEFSFATPATDAASVTEAQSFYTEGVTLATDITKLPTTDYGLIALDNALSSFDQWVLPDQIETIAGLAYGFAGL
jgi:hypothetical protein